MRTWSDPRVDQCGHAGEGPDGPKKDDGADGALKFTSIGGSGKKTLSGAEKQALARKLELVLKTTAAQAEQAQQKKAKAAESCRSSRLSIGSGQWIDTGWRGCKYKARSKDVGDGSAPRDVDQEHASECAAEEQRRLRGIYRTFAGDRDGNFPDGEASTQIGARSSLM